MGAVRDKIKGIIGAGFTTSQYDAIESLVAERDREIERLKEDSKNVREFRDILSAMNWSLRDGLKALRDELQRVMYSSNPSDYMKTVGETKDKINELLGEE